MKKNYVFTAMAAILTAAALTGCQGGSNQPAETTAATTAATEAAVTEAASKEETTAAESAETEAAKSDAAADSKFSPELKEAAYADVEPMDLSGVDPNGEVAKILAAGKITLGTSPDFAPSEFEDVSSGETKYAGSDIELAKYIAKRMGVELEIKAMEFSAIQQAVASGTVDIGISGFAYTEERAEALGLTTFFNMDSESGQGLLVKKDMASEYNTAESFAGKKIATQNASLQYKLTTAQLPGDVKIQLITAITDGVMMLATGKVDAVAVSGDNGESLAKAYPELAMADFKFDYSSDGNVAAVKKENTELLSVVNEILTEVNEKGYYPVWVEDAKALADSLGIKME